MSRSASRAMPSGLGGTRQQRLLICGITGALALSHLLIFELGTRQGLREGTAINNEITKVVKLAFARRR